MRRGDVWAFDAWERHHITEARLKPKWLLEFFGSFAITDAPASRSIGQLRPVISFLPFATFYRGDDIYCPIAQALVSKLSSGADHVAADDAGEQVLDRYGLADWKQQFVADQWQYAAVGLIHRGEAP